jgi:hypothetical protein
MAHMHYAGTGKMHSFKGLIPNGEQRKISIQGSVGSIAWKINKFQIIQKEPGTNHAEAIVKIFREEQSTIDAVINFDNSELLAAGYYEDNESVTYNHSTTVIFSNELFSRNIHITSFHATSHTDPMNYYIELEEVKIGATGMAQLAVAAARRTATR